MVATSQDEAAETLGIDSRTFARWLKRGCPGKPRNYVIRDCIQWARENCWSEEAVLIEGATGDDDDIKTQYLKARTEKLRREIELHDLKIETQNDRLVDPVRIEETLQRQAGVFRDGLERLERSFGREALDMVIKLIEEVEKLDFTSA